MSEISSIRNILEKKEPSAKLKTLVRSGLAGGDEDYNLVVKILKDPKYAAQNPEFRPKLLQIMQELINAITQDELVYNRTRTTVKRKDVKKEEFDMDLIEGRMNQIHSDIKDAIDKHVDSYNKGHCGADQFGNHCIKAAEKIAKIHGIKKEHAQKFVNSYVDSQVKEETMLDETKKLEKVIAAAKNILDKTEVVEETTITETTEVLDEGRGRPRKNPDDPKWQKKPAAKKSGSDDDDEEEDYGPDKGPEPDQNIRNQLHKVVDTAGKHKVKFEDGKSHNIHPAHAKTIINGLNKLKPVERLKVQNKLYKSHKDLMDVHAAIDGKK